MEYGRLRPLILFPLLALSAPGLAQDAMPPSDVGQDNEPALQGDEILVVATRIRGELDVPQPPVMTLDENDVASYGVASLSELLTQISPQTGSGRGRGDGHPVVLVNGQRVSSFRELRSIPPEAIRKVDVLPEEVALRFGYPPDQRVVNFILKDNFSSVTFAGEYNVPTRGGMANSELEGELTRIAGASRLNIEAKMVDDTLLTEAERGVIQAEGNIPTVAGDPDPAEYRSLTDDKRELTFNATWSSGLGKDGQDGNLSLNAAYTRTDARSLSGLDTVLLVSPEGDSALRSLPDPLTNMDRTNLFEAGVTFNKPVGDWLLSITLDAAHSDLKSLVDREADTSALAAAAAAGTLAVDAPLPALGDAGIDRSRSRDTTLDSLATLSGSAFRLPAGDTTLTLSAGFDYSRNQSSDTRNGGDSTSLKRGDASAGVNISLPITSRKEGVLDAIGDISLNVSGAVNHLSDFGTLTGWSAGLTWAPTGKLGFQASYIVDEEAPSLSQLSSPERLSFNIPVFDFTRGETALVTIIRGGNPALVGEKQRDIKLAGNWELPLLRRSNLIVEYFRNRSSNVTQAFPLLTPAIEAAFPGRVVRDAAGQLISIDRRPVKFSEIAGSNLRWGVNLSGQIGKEPEGRRGGDHGPGMGGRRSGRWSLSVYHTYRFDQTVTIAKGGPVLDLLHGDALADGGTARHLVELEGGAFHKGFGLRLKGEWTGPAHVRSSGSTGSTDLRFGSAFDLEARVFVNLGMQQSLVSNAPFLKGLFVAFEFKNILDSRQKVTDEAGAVPLNYQAAYREPIGRMVGIDLRKMF